MKEFSTLFINILFKHYCYINKLYVTIYKFNLAIYKLKSRGRKEHCVSLNNVFHSTRISRSIKKYAQLGVDYLWRLLGIRLWSMQAESA